MGLFGLDEIIMNYCWTPGKNEIVSIKDVANNQSETPVTSEII